MKLQSILSYGLETKELNGFIHLSNENANIGDQGHSKLLTWPRLSEVTEGGTQHDEEKSSFLVCMRGRAGYIHEYAKDLGMNDDETVYPSFYLRQRHCQQQ